MSLLRTAVPADAAGVVALRALVHPYLVRGEASTKRMIESPPPGEDWTAFVAERDGQVVGWVSAFRNIRAVEPDTGFISLLHVHPGHRGPGVGAALFDAAAGHLRRLGVRTVSGMSSAEGLEFAGRRGFRSTAEVRYSSLDLATFDVTASAPPPGLRLVSLREVTERALYEADVAATVDEPMPVPSEPLSLETWRYEIWDSPSLDRAASVAVVTGSGQIVAFTLVNRDGERIWSDMTATRIAYRGKGLARLAKIAALRAAAASGATVGYTSNDETNLPMLAVNTRLGYRPAATQFVCLGALG